MEPYGYFTGTCQENFSSKAQNLQNGKYGVAVRRYASRIHIMVIVFLLACTESVEKRDTLFTLLEGDDTNIEFANQLDFKGSFNIYTYRNFYNGGGVGLADINNDGLLDIYFVANMSENKLYLNKGSFEFEDITESSNCAGSHGWSTGVSMADVNGDGWIDIYVCNSGEIEGDDRRNELFINNGDLTFSEKAEQFGLNDPGYSIHGAFFDFDKDNDLDFYLCNNSYKAIGSFDLRNNLRTERDSLGADKLFRNDNNNFIDISEEAGIYGSIIGFALGVTVGDINFDGWQDMYISNDFFERDYMYINLGDGTFREVLIAQMKSVSAASMGSDIGDINNDLYPDIFVTDMLPRSDARMKTVTTFENWGKYQENLTNDYYHQFTRNMLHLNNGDGTFSEIGRYANVQSTDWSWGALIFDMNNDGYKDLFVANGIFQDLTDQDFIQYFSNREVVKTIVQGRNVDYEKLISSIPTEKLSNFAFQNQGKWSFSDQSSDWGLAKPSFSNGSAYGDLDNDGDFDLVVNNVNMPAFVFQNNNEDLNPKNRYIRLSLIGLGGNSYAIGAKVIASAKGHSYCIEQMPTRGYQSTMDHNLILGLGDVQQVDSLIIVWPDGRMTRDFNISANQSLLYKQTDATEDFDFSGLNERHLIFNEITSKVLCEFIHKENKFVDFKRDRLIYHMISSEGPRIIAGDINSDGRDDLYIGGAKDSPGTVLVQDHNGDFIDFPQSAIMSDALSEDTNGEFFDADNDGDLDLYVTSGSIELPNSSSGLIDRLYFNDGQGNFTKSNQVLPSFNFESTSCVQASDFDEDGDLDLFVGVRSRPFMYGIPTNGYLLENDGAGRFTNITAKIAPDLIEIGMITDASWADVDNDGDRDLVIVGEYMPLTIMRNDNGTFSNKTEDFGLKHTNGWWNTLCVNDLDDDGDLDFIAGNHGLNSMFKGSYAEPIQLYVNDFDHNGSLDHITCIFKNGISYPHILKHDLIEQLPGLSSKYLKYEDFRYQTIDSIFTPDQLKDALVLQAYHLETSMAINNGNGIFSVQVLPKEAQISPVYAICVYDYDQDGIKDVVLGGNLYDVKPEVGRYDASFGVFLKGQEGLKYTSIPSKESGLKMDGQVRDFQLVENRLGVRLLVARNNDELQVFEIR
jgi:hypothetical protein